jgi:hypothetical protein
MDNLQKDRDNWHEVENQLLSIKCPHKHVEQRFVIDPVNGTEYYGHCTDCGEDMI